MTYRKKLIEVALPLAAINAAAGREKSIRHGHPSTLHLWWARRPLAAARAVLFAQLVDDPSAWPERFPTEEAQETERLRLFSIIERFVPWEASNDEAIINEARREIAQSWARSHPSDKATRVLAADATPELINDYLATELPPVHDPFAGGGTIPLEAQRLGLRAIATDLNPVAVLINKALIEIPPRFAGRPPVNPSSRREAGLRNWKGAQGLAEDVRYYGAWMREEAKKRIGHLYPDVEVTEALAKDRPDLNGLVGKRLTVIAWLWARTVASPNPALGGAHVPLVSSFWLSTKEDRRTWVEPVIEADGKSYRFVIRTGTPAKADAVDAGTKLGRGANFRCVLSGIPIEPDYIKAEGMQKRMGARLMAIVAEGNRRRIYLNPTLQMETTAESASPAWQPEQDLPNDPRNFWTVQYGLSKFSDLFTHRQLVALTTFSDLVNEARERAMADAQVADLGADLTPLRSGGKGVGAYGDAVATYLGLGVARYSNASSTICTWNPGDKKEDIRFTFARQALPMTWDFAEGNPFSASSGNLTDNFDTWLFKAIALLGASTALGTGALEDAATGGQPGTVVISTDPPYYDNIGYADLSDFFYVWLRRNLREIFPDETKTLLVPKEAELVATPYRHGGRQKAESFFLEGMTRALGELARRSVPDSPATIYYAFKQSETGEEGTSSTGWETFLEAIVQSGFSICGTWPVRTERAGRSIEIGTNALASSVILVCRKRDPEASTITRGDFRRELRAELAPSLRALQRGNIAPVDVAQASIGPGMGIFSRHAKVLEADGSPMTVKSALQLINEALDEFLGESENDFDADTRFAITWYEQRGWDAGPYGDAETLAKARNVSVSGVVEAGICHSAAGKVRILRRPEMRPLEYDPATDERPTIWEYTQHLIRLLETEGEVSAASLLKKLGPQGAIARELAYRLYSTCERKGWAEDARSYNGIVIAWPELEKLAANVAASPASRAQLSLGSEGSDEPPAKKKRAKRSPS